MKNRVLLLVVCSLLVLFTADIALAEWQIEFSDKLVNEMRKAGYQIQKRVGSFATKAECEKARESASRATGCHPNSMADMKCVGYDTPSSTTRSPTPKTPTINWSALEAKYFAEADQKGWTHIRIEFGSEKRYYKKENGNWVRTNAEYRTPEDQRKDQQKKERLAREERERKRLLKKRQGELERQKELFELGKSDLLKMLKGAGGQQGLKLKPAPIEQENGVWSDPNVVDLSDKESDTPILLGPASEEGTGPAPDVDFGNWYRGREPKVDGELGVVSRKLAEWFGELWKDKTIDWISSKTGFPLDKILKIRGIESLIYESTTKPVMQCLEEARVAAVTGNLVLIAEVCNNETIKESGKAYQKELRNELTIAGPGTMGPTGDRIGDLVGASKKAYDINKDHSR